jgi:hypothetical protein
MASNEAKINLTLAFVLNNATIDDKGNVLQNPSASVVQANIVNRVKQSTYAKDFTLVWGPSIFLDPGTKNGSKTDSKGYSANVTAVFKGPSGDFRVVTSGTNGKSNYDVNEEDNDVLQTQANALISDAPDDANISNGAMAGANNILNTPSSQGDLVSYLKSQLASGGTLIVVGHSLGGALASVLALYLKGKLPSATLSCFTFAAPTAGNQQFADYFDQTMTGASTRIFNSKDTVPNAWSASTITNIEKIYYPDVATPEDTVKAINSNLGWLALLNYQQPTAGQQQLTGAVNETLVEHNDQDFPRQAGYQHVEAYLDLLGMQATDVWQPPVVATPAQASAA